MKGKVNSDLGDIVINPEVITTYAGSVAVECFGIVGMAAVNMKDGLVKILKKDSLKHGIHVSINDNRISIDFHVIVAYGVNIGTIAQNLIDSVTYKLEETTGMKVDKIRVLVEGVRIID
ncbi:MAG: Asp23/Gls24 family envelope stress response protein [Eubacterium sp.]|nr:Asp23/Gls24 family envelope stress response protein [Eubacterium sp.]